MEDKKSTDQKFLCKDLPNLLNSFVDTFVDFCVTGKIYPKPLNPNPNPMQTIYPAPDRLIALGDLHGDLGKSKQALRLAGLIDGSDRWTGGSATLVQIGDVLDRGGDELKLLYFFERLRSEAARHGGEIITMNGNHEIMNMDGDFKCTSESGFEEFRVWGNFYKVGNAMKSLCHGLPKPVDIFRGIPSCFLRVKPELYVGYRARMAALRPKGPISTRFLSRNRTVAVIGDSVFVHGGLLPRHVDYGLQRINQDVRDWITGQKMSVSSQLVRNHDSVVWLRKYSDEKKYDSPALKHVLATIPGVKRMVMGHTIQRKGINGVCGNQAIRIDVGLSKGCGNRWPEVLEINKGKKLRILTSNPAVQTKRSAQKDKSKNIIKRIKIATSD